MQTKYFILSIVIMSVLMIGQSQALNKNWYIGGTFGSVQSATADTVIPSIFGKPPLTSEPVYHTGYLYGLNVGYRYRPFRIEGEFAYQYLPMYKINNAIGAGTITTVSHSDTHLFSVFINGYYDFHFFNRFIPYIGIGGGYVDVNNTIKPNPPIPVAPGLFFTEKQLNYSTWGYQGIAGVLYQVTDDVQLSLDYTYFSTLNHEAVGQTNLGPDGYSTQQKITENIITLGIKYYFL